MNRLHLVCNAHLDPMWMWEWEEGVAAAIATFRVAADFCSEDYIIRLFEPTGQPRTTPLDIPAIRLGQKISLGAFEIKTLRLNVKTKTLTETGLME